MQYATGVRSKAGARLDVVSPPKRPKSSRAGGFSLVEVLIAGALLLVISLGILPLFTRSMTLNSAGRVSTQISQYARSSMEELISASLNAPSLTIPAGETELEVISYFEDASEGWIAEADHVPGSGWFYRKTVRVRQYNVGALADNELTAGERLDGSSASNLVDLKEIEVIVESYSGADTDDETTSGRRIALHSIKVI
jgi:type II secretory pathway pseudopilin PulG